MNLDLFNNLLNNAKEKNFVPNFIKELSDYLENNKSSTKSGLKEDNCLYQVVEIGLNSVFLQNVNTNKIYEEKDIPKELLNKIVNDTVLIYKNGQYVIEEKITQDFFDSLIDIKEFKEIQDKFIKESNILQIDSSTKYNVQERGNDYTILNYGDNKENTITVPNALIPFFTTNKTILYYENGNFNRDL